MRLVGTREALSVAPMMEYTDRHFRYLFRQLSRETTLYTEMVSANAVADESGQRRAGLTDSRLAELYGYDDPEHKTVLQLGGSCPAQLSGAAQLAKPFAYSAINLNCGCPSERVAGSGCFGAALMKNASLVAACCRALEDGGTPVTVKCRVGAVPTVRDVDVGYDALRDFVGTIATESSVRRFQVHARVAVLSGLSPDANRKVPPLRPDLVRRLVDDFPGLDFVFNGQVATVEAARDALDEFHGAMVGRDVYRRPWYWSSVDADLFGRDLPAASRRDVLDRYAAYATACESHPTVRSPRRSLVKPLLNLFFGDRGATAFKRALDDLLRNQRTLPFDAMLRHASTVVPDDVLDAPPTRQLFSDTPDDRDRARLVAIPSSTVTGVASG